MGLKKLNKTLREFGIDIRKFLDSSIGIRKYIRDLRNFNPNNWDLKHTFIFSDYKKTAGDMGGHYFHQDLLIAQKIFENNPKKHFDVGSRIDGFVTHVASFRKIDIMDIRPLNLKVGNISSFQGDLCNLNLIEKYDSVSCLHVLEHIGLGRYGDKLMKDGYKKAIKNLINITSKGGIIYVSVPISNYERIEFNAHRVFNVKTILKEFQDLKLVSFSFVDDNGELYKNIELNGEMKCSFGLGIFEFKKV